MTQAVARACQSAAEAIAQPAVSKATVGTTKASGRFSSNEARSKPLEKTDEGATGDVPVSTPRSIQKSAKTDSRPMDETQTGDADSSFAATIDDMNSAGGQPLPDAAPALTWNAELLVAAQSALAQAPQDKVGVAEVQQAPAKVPLGAANLLKQESIAALLNAKDRLVANQSSTTSDQNPIAAASVVVNSKETHWSFDGKAASSALVHVALSAPTVSVNSPPVERADAGALDATKDAVQSNSPAELVPAKASENIAPSPAAKAVEFSIPIAAPRSAKVQDAGPKPVSNTTSRSAPQSVAAPAFTDPTSSQTWDGGQQDTADTRQQTPSNKPAITVAGAEASKAADRIADVSTSSAATPTVTDQVSKRIVDALAGKTGEAKAPEPTSVLPSRSIPPPQVLKSIDVTLSPADLGSVRLKLTLKSNTLAIEAEASKASTAQILHNDRTTLEHSLRDAGYDVSSVKITDSSAASSGSGSWQSGGSAFREGEQSRSTFAGRQDGEFQRRDGAAPDRGQQRPGNNAGQNPSAADTQIGQQSNAIYI